MKIKIFFITIFTIFLSYGQDKNPDKKAYKKRVLETIEIDFLASYYNQEGSNASR